jgi:hypothetical protein
MARSLVILFAAALGCGGSGHVRHVAITQPKGIYCGTSLETGQLLWGRVRLKGDIDALLGLVSRRRAFHIDKGTEVSISGSSKDGGVASATILSGSDVGEVCWAPDKAFTGGLEF